MLAQDVERAKDQIDSQAARTEEYGLLTENVLMKVAQLSNKEKEKLRAYRAILLNSARPGAPDEIKRNYHLGLVDRLQEVHILLLSLLYDPGAFANAHQIFFKPPCGLDKFLQDCFQPFGVEGEFLWNVIRSLEDMGIVTPKTPRANVLQPIAYKQTYHSQSQAEHDLKSLLTGLGREFAHFITLHE